MKILWKSVTEYLLALVDILLPERKRAAKIRHKELHDFALAPTSHELLGTRITTLLDYKNPEVVDLVRALKYEHSGRAADICAAALADFLYEEISSVKTFSARPVVLIPMPLHKDRQRERGFNQMHRIFSRLPEEFRTGTISHIDEKSLERIKNTKQQARLSRAERLQNVSEAFQAAPSLSNAHVFLVDDVTTTGATLASAAKPLRAVGAKVTLIALARA